MTIKFGCAMVVGLSLLACGGSTDGDGAGGNGAGGADAGAGAGGTGNAAGSGAAGSGGATGGAAGTGATGGSAGASGGSAGSGATGGAGGASGGAGGASGGTGGGTGANCVGLDYCSCKGANADCQVFSEKCFCPCGVEPCEPSCSCACSGGKYLGCGPKSVYQPGALEGIWLIGWSGGLNHYSWIRFNADQSIDVLDGAKLPVNAPLWPCTGKGTFGLAAKPQTVFVYLPAACGSGTPLTFDKFGPPSDGYVKGTVLTASITAGPGQTLEGYKFAPTQCDAAMTTCKDPF